MRIEFDSTKRDKTLAERGLDFARAGEVFTGLHFTGQDTRQDYEEDRFITVGPAGCPPGGLVRTPRGEVRRIISMRKAKHREKTFYTRHLD